MPDNLANIGRRRTHSRKREYQDCFGCQFLPWTGPRRRTDCADLRGSRIEDDLYPWEGYQERTGRQNLCPVSLRSSRAVAHERNRLVVHSASDRVPVRYPTLGRVPTTRRVNAPPALRLGREALPAKRRSSRARCAATRWVYLSRYRLSP